MNQSKTGDLIKRLRKERGMTQKQLAERIHVSDKAVSKWECGNGCPDISLLAALAEVFDTDIHVLLTGEIAQKESEKGNMKKTKFYVCKSCGNIITASAEAAVNCCGSRLSPLEPRKAAPDEMLQIEDIGGEWYPEWDFHFTMPMYRMGRLVWYCTQCGFLYQDIRRR